MSSLSVRIFAALVSAAVAITMGAWAVARGEDQPAQEQKAAGAQAGDKEEKKKIDEFAEAARSLPGPAGQPECVWLGRRVVNLLWRDDLDTAFRHLDLYDRFNCPSAHIQETFRCVVRQGNIDPKSPESLNSRVHACWINPGLPPATASTAPPPGSAQGTSSQ
jgi:hypothetical protein